MGEAAPYRTYVVLLTPEAEPFIGEIRRAHTPGAQRGMPAHVTLLGPFIDADALCPDGFGRLSRAVGSVPAFEFSFASVERFDSAVLYLSVDPVARFRALIRHLCDEFPEFKPYGVYTADTVIPHQTLATGEGFPDRPTAKVLDVFARVEAQISALLPIKCRAEHVAVVADGPHGWSIAWQTTLR